MVVEARARNRIKKLPEKSDLRLIDVLPPYEFSKGYAAGFFDGEGSVGLYIQKNRPKPIISITNCSWHVLNYLQALILPLLEVDFSAQKDMQIRISAWEDVKNFVEVFKDICIVKREQLELMHNAVKMHENLVKKRKGKKVYSQDDVEIFNQIANEIKKAKKSIIYQALLMEKYRKEA
jgi:hypothetical protein